MSFLLQLNKERVCHTHCEPCPRSPTHLSVEFFVDIGHRVQLLQDSNDRLVVRLAHRAVEVAVLSFLQTAGEGAGRVFNEN